MIKLFEHKIHTDTEEAVPLCWKVLSTVVVAFLLLAMTAICAACQQQDMKDGEKEGHPALIRLKVMGEEHVDVTTRTVNEDAIRDLHILIYDGKGKLIGQQYTTGGTVTVKTRSAADCTIYAIANTGEPELFNSCNIHSETTIKELTHSISAWDELTNATYLLMTGSMDGVNIAAGIQNLTVLKVNRIVAKIILNIEIMAGSGISVTNYSVCKSPTKSYYISRPMTTENDQYDTDNIQVGDDAPNNKWIDSPTIPITNNKVSTSFYMFENRRGVNRNIKVQNDKGHNNTPSNATYININGTINGNNINWKIYLGANNTDNFNIKRNCTYTYNIVLNAKGTADSRVTIETMGIINLSNEGTANCYLASNNDQWYSFNATIRGNGETEDYAAQQYNSVSPGISLMPSKVGASSSATQIPVETIKDAVVVWETTQGLIDWVIWDCNSGQVKFKTKVAKGNAVIAVRDASLNILWSWHIWRTDGINLNMLNSNTSKHVMKITTNTDRQWYADLLGRTDVKRRRTITMLKCNIGAQLNDASGYNTPEGNLGIFNLQYQFGRKDPFPGGISYTIDENKDVTVYGYGSSNNYQTAGFTIGNSLIPATSFDSNAKLILDYTITHPEIFIYGNTWLNSSTLRSVPWMISRCLWGDNNTANRSVNNGGLDPEPWGTAEEKGKKTIYDPCPSGWRVAAADSWSGIANESMSASWINIGNYVFKDDFNKGYILYFNSKTSGISTYIPATGRRGYATGKLEAMGHQGGIWWSSPSGSNTYSGTYFYAINSSNGIHIASDYNQAIGFPIRCVKIEP